MFFVVLYIMDERENILLANFNEYFELAEEAFKNKHYNSAVTLFFKAISAGTDLFILRKEGFVPSSHTHRFRIVQEKYIEIYNILDKDFPFYQDSYISRMNKEATEVLREDAKRIKEKFELSKKR